MFKPPIKVIPIDQPQKFNMDISNQELLHEILITSARYALWGEPITRFNSLKQARVMISPGLNKTRQEELIKKQTNLKIGIDQFNAKIVAFKGALFFSEDARDYTFKEGYLNAHTEDTPTLPLDFVILRDQLNIEEDVFEEMIRTDMKRIGMVLLRGQTGEDATDA